jgi:hypothetical protein
MVFEHSDSPDEKPDRKQKGLERPTMNLAEFGSDARTGCSIRKLHRQTQHRQPFLYALKPKSHKAFSIITFITVIYVLFRNEAIARPWHRRAFPEAFLLFFRAWRLLRGKKVIRSVDANHYPFSCGCRLHLILLLGGQICRLASCGDTKKRVYLCMYLRQFYVRNVYL